MESMTVQVLLGELETARESLDRAFACLLPASMFPEDLDTEELISATDAPRSPTIKVMTENGFCIERVCEREGSNDSASACHFVVRGPNDEERRLIVAFAEAAIGLIQRVQGSNSLSLTSPFWTCVAESHLATYLWEKDNYPPDGRLTIDSDCLLSLPN